MNANDPTPQPGRRGHRRRSRAPVPPRAGDFVRVTKMRVMRQDGKKGAFELGDWIEGILAAIPTVGERLHVEPVFRTKYTYLWDWFYTSPVVHLGRRIRTENSTWWLRRVPPPSDGEIAWRNAVRDYALRHIVAKMRGSKGPANGGGDNNSIVDRAQMCDGYASPEEGLASLLIAEGGCVGIAKACRLFRRAAPVDRQTLLGEIRARRLVAYRTETGRWQIPKWQFGPRGGILKGLPAVLNRMRELIPVADELFPFVFFLQPDPFLGGRTPLAAIRAGESEKVIAALESYPGIAPG